MVLDALASFFQRKPIPADSPEEKRPEIPEKTDSELAAIALYKAFQKGGQWSIVDISDYPGDVSQLLDDFKHTFRIFHQITIDELLKSRFNKPEDPVRVHTLVVTGYSGSILGSNPKKEREIQSRIRELQGDEGISGLLLLSDSLPDERTFNAADFWWHNGPFDHDGKNSAVFSMNIDTASHTVTLIPSGYGSDTRREYPDAQITVSREKPF